ncbi:MAG: hypothetical protein GX913_02115 [Clostridiales bacterium]|nr:hypothetical protein [Clostridiales bacterium]
MKTKDIALIGFLSAILFVSQLALAFLPNIEVVSLLVIIYTLVFKRKVFFIIYVFAILEGIFYGFGTWWIMYLYVWTILALFTLWFQKNKSHVFWSLISALYGLSFGALCAIPYFFIGGWSMGAAFWVSGIPFDIIHCIGNFAVTLILFKPTLAILRYLNNKYI